MAALLLGACTAFTGAGEFQGPRPGNRLTRLQIVASADANANTATTLDIVWVFKAEALDQLPRNGREWFANKAALMAGLGRDVAVLQLEVPPGSVLQKLPLPADGGRAIAVLAYPDFATEAGQAVGSLNSYDCATIELGAASVRYASCP